MLIRLDTLQPWTGERIGDVLYPPIIEQIWTAEALAAIGLAVPQPFTAPTGFHAVGAPRYELSGGKAITLYDIAADVAPVPEALTRWQFFTVAALQAIISQDDALAAVQVGMLPRPFADFIAGLPRDQQFPARMLLAGTGEFHRHHPFVEAFLQARGMTEDQADALWIAGAGLTLN